MNEKTYQLRSGKCSVFGILQIFNFFCGFLVFYVFFLDFVDFFAMPLIHIQQLIVYCLRIRKL